MPDVRGLDVVTALDLANRHGLGLQVTARVVNTAHPSHAILTQDPQAGAVGSQRGGLVRVVVSTGLRPMTVPAVQGLVWQDAKATLERDGARLGDLLRIHSDRVPRDRVIAQSPPGDAKSIRGRPVALLVSEGPWPGKLCDAGPARCRARGCGGPHDRPWAPSPASAKRTMTGRRPAPGAWWISSLRPDNAWRRDRRSRWVLATREPTPTSRVGDRRRPAVGRSTPPDGWAARPARHRPTGRADGLVLLPPPDGLLPVCALLSWRLDARHTATTASRPPSALSPTDGGCSGRLRPAVLDSPPPQRNCQAIPPVLTLLPVRVKTPVLA